MRFNEIIGNDDKKEYLNNIVKSQKISNSYIFAGNSGIGKMLFAKEFARKILCLKNGNDDCTCKSCSSINYGNPDLIILDKQEDEEFSTRREESIKEYEKLNGIKSRKSSKSKKEDSETEKKKKKIISVDEVRNLISKLIEKPVCSQRKVCIINDADAMNKNAQNCLLKTLEEPPKFLTIILVVSDTNKLLNTIKSRCNIIKFSQISNDVLEKYAKEKLGYDDISKNMIIAFNGSIGCAKELKVNIDKYSHIEDFISSVDKVNLIEFIKKSKVIYDKECITDILDYMVVCLYSKSNDKYSKFIECIKYINECNKRLMSNTNFNMCLDDMVLKIWEEINENRYRGEV